MYCIKCGAQNENNNEFCTNCGESLSESKKAVKSYKGNSKIATIVLCILGSILCLGTMTYIFFFAIICNLGDTDFFIECISNRIVLPFIITFLVGVFMIVAGVITSIKSSERK